jgi:hypothetical protein
MRKEVWTEAEKATLQNLYGKTSKEKIAAQLGKTIWSVRSMAKKLNLTVSNLWWTPEQEEQLRQLYPTMDVASLAQALNRSVASIYMKAHELRAGNVKLKRRNKLSIGDERLNSHGLLVRKMTDTGNQWKDWKRVDVIEWEAIHGPVPAGKVLARVNPYLPRSPSNMAVYSKQELSAHFTGIGMPPEMRELMSLKRQILKELGKAPVQQTSNSPESD